MVRAWKPLLPPTDSHPSDKERPMDGAQFHTPWVGNVSWILDWNYE